MPPLPTHYRLPSRIPAKTLIGRLGAVADIRPEPPVASTRAFLDSADWRLRSAGWTLAADSPAAHSSVAHSSVAHSSVAERDGDAGALTLVLADAATGATLATARPVGPARFAADLPKTPPWDRVGAALDNRRLLAQVEADSRSQRFAVLNADGKTTARVVLTRYTLNAGQPPRNHTVRRVTVIAVRGYERSFAEVNAEVVAAGLSAEPRPVLEELLEIAGLPEPGAQAGPGVPLDRSTPAYRALGSILERLRYHVLSSEEGTREQLDIEFLHDYRVAIRRARSMVRQASGVLGRDASRSFASELGWLAGITGPVRDYDVHLEQLAVRAEPEIEPLRAYLTERREGAQQDLVDAMDSARYRGLLETWRTIAARPGSTEQAPEAGRPVGEVADEHIAWAYRRVIKRGRAIDDSSRPELLHDLRKRAKELRYLLECFQTLYPGELRAPAVKELKALQDNLGEYQDCQVQAAAMRTMADDLLERRVAPAATLMTMGRLADELERREARAREEFRGRFARFSSAANRRRFDALVAPATPAAGEGIS